MGKLRLLLVCPTGGYAGVDVCFEQLVLGIDREKFEPVVVLPNNSYLQPKFMEEGIKVLSHKLVWWFPTNFNNKMIYSIFDGAYERVKFLCDVIELEKIDVVYSNTTVFFDAAIAAHIKKRPHVWHIHASFVDNIYTGMDQETKKFVYQMIGELSDVVVTPSESLRKFLCDYMDQEKIRVVYNGVDPKKHFPNFKKSERKEKDIICVGHFNDNKNQLMLVSMMKHLTQQLKEKNPEIGKLVKLKLVGPSETEYLKKVKKRIKELKLEENIELVDFSDNIPELLRESTIIVSASKTETFPISLIEGLATAKPIVATKTEGAVEILVHEQTGYVVEQEDEVTFADQLAKLLVDHALYDTFCKNAYQRFVDCFDINQYITKFESVFEQVKHQYKGSPSDEFSSLQLIKTVEIIARRKGIPGKKPKILAITPGTSIITTEISVKTPLEFMSERGLLTFKMVTPAEIRMSELNTYDLILNLRLFDARTIETLDMAKSMGVPFIFLTDDNYFALKFENHGNQVKAIHESVEDENLVHMFRDSDCVLIFSKELEEKALTLNPKVYRIPTYQQINKNPAELSQQKEKDVITIGYMGSYLKDLDFEFVEEAIVRILEEFKGKVKFEFIGFIPERLKTVQGIKHYGFIEDYHKFKEFFKSLEWDIALAPLAVTTFNKSKTNNKFREYSSYGIPGIYTDIITYRECVTNEENGLLVGNEVEQWYQGMKRLILDGTLRKQIAVNAIEYVREHMSIETYCERLNMIFNVYKESDPTSIKGKLIPITEDAGFDQASRAVNTLLSYEIHNLERDGLKGLKVSFGTHNQTLEGELTVEVYSKRHKQVLRSASIDLSSISDNGWHMINFIPIEDSKGDSYQIEFKFDIQDGKAISIYETYQTMNILTKLRGKFGKSKGKLKGFLLFND